jgi:hypothetical protein
MFHNQPCLFIQYTLFASFLHSVVRFVSNDKVIADYGVPFMYNVGYLFTVLSSLMYEYSVQQRATIINHVISALVGYYITDTVTLYFDKTAKYRLAYMMHHVVSIQLLYLHYCGVLPLSIGIIYLTLFEVSNLFLPLYQLCLYKGWHITRNKLAHPMVFTYVPVRLIAIPLCSIMYWYAFEKYNHQGSAISYIGIVHVYCKALLSLLNMYSIYYGFIVGYKYCMYLIKK